MKKRKRALKQRKKILQWQEIAYHCNTKCPKCGQKMVWLVYEYDAKACIICNEWIDAVCSDKNCFYCSNRPQTPYEVYYFSDSYKNNAFYRKYWRCCNYQHKKYGEIKHQTIKYNNK